MRIIISNASAEPVSGQIARQIRAEIVSGKLKERTALPSIRALAHDLQVGVITAERAYEELETEGFLDSATGRGIQVAARVPSRSCEKRVERLQGGGRRSRDARRTLQQLFREVAVAAEVQRRLLPQKPVPMTTVDYAGGCRQAHTVGGDYYDFLDLGPGHLGLVLGDVSGKGLYAALLMANLQASVRSFSARAAADLAPALERVNRSFYESTGGHHFATLFVGHYDDSTRRFCYANCGHCPPFLLRATGEVERLAVTAAALGMFDASHCDARQLELRPNDLLVIFSDGVTDATNAGGEEFGETRLLAALGACRDAAAPAIVAGVMAAVQGFSTRPQHDDITVVAARGRNADN